MGKEYRSTATQEGGLVAPGHHQRTHQVHDCIDFVVAVQDVHEEFVQLSHIRDGAVFGVTDPLGKVAEDVGSGE